ncbi:MFS transporter [Peribacillus sp. Hz7]|uniref:MFS transporter n=1 Tax=Peribacillus sp. Hz7 TaxID=3344873 RepID=UPI0035CBCEE9
MDEKLIRRAFHFLCLGTLLIVFAEATHIPAYPKMLEHFNLGAGHAVWMQLGFALGLTGFQPLMGWLADYFGQKKVILLGAALMAFGSCLVALAPAFWVMVLGLFFKGVSGAAVVPIGVTYAGKYFNDEQRGKALGLFGFYSVVGAILGPVLSGIFVDNLGWSSNFWVCALFGLLAVVLFLIGVPNTKGEKSISFDFLGVLFVFLILGSLLTIPTFINNYGFSSWMWLPSFIVFVLAFLFLIVIEKRQKEPLLDINYATTRHFWVPSVIAILMFVTFSSVLFLLTFFIQNVQGKSSTMVGLLELPLFLTMAIANLLSGRLMSKFSARSMIGSSIVLLVAGVGMLTLANKDTSFLYLFVSMSLIGMAIGMVGPVIRNVIVSKADPSRLGVITFTYITIENVASRVGASFAIVMFALFAAGGNSVGALSTTALILAVFSAISFIFLVLIPKRVEGIQGVNRALQTHKETNLEEVDTIS